MNKTPQNKPDQIDLLMDDVVIGTFVDATTTTNLLEGAITQKRKVMAGKPHKAITIYRPTQLHLVPYTHTATIRILLLYNMGGKADGHHTHTAAAVNGQL